MIVEHSAAHSMTHSMSPWQPRVHSSRHFPASSGHLIVPTGSTLTLPGAETVTRRISSLGRGTRLDGEDAARRGIHGKLIAVWESAEKRRSGYAETATFTAAAFRDDAIPVRPLVARSPLRCRAWLCRPRATNPGVRPRTCSTRSCRRTSRRFAPRLPACGMARVCPDSSKGSSGTSCAAGHRLAGFARFRCTACGTFRLRAARGLRSALL